MKKLDRVTKLSKRRLEHKPCFFPSTLFTAGAWENRFAFTPSHYEVSKKTKEDRRLSDGREKKNVTKVIIICCCFTRRHFSSFKITVLSPLTTSKRRPAVQREKRTLKTNRVWPWLGAPSSGIWAKRRNGYGESNDKSPFFRLWRDIW